MYYYMYPTFTYVGDWSKEKNHFDKNSREICLNLDSRSDLEV